MGRERLSGGRHYWGSAPQLRSVPEWSGRHLARFPRSRHPPGRNTPSRVPIIVTSIGVPNTVIVLKNASIDKLISSYLGKNVMVVGEKLTPRLKKMSVVWRTQGLSQVWPDQMAGLCPLILSLALPNVRTKEKPVMPTFNGLGSEIMWSAREQCPALVTSGRHVYLPISRDGSGLE
jgi:hypothetical protein